MVHEVWPSLMYRCPRSKEYFDDSCYCEDDPSCEYFKGGGTGTMGKTWSPTKTFTVIKCGYQNSASKVNPNE